MIRLQLLLTALVFSFSVSAQKYHVAKTGNDNNNGTLQSPFLSIQTAANIAQPGDVITVHEGVYRERVNPLRGGTSDDKRIVYQAAKGEKVGIKGSEKIDNWENFKGTVWKTTMIW